jgi:hypothetical protein
MDVFYEESSISSDITKGSKKYIILNVFSIIFLVLGVFSLILLLTTPINLLILGILQSLMFFGFWFLFRKWKMRYNLSYDYAFVSGELRIAMVFNVNKRKLLTRFDCEEIIQVGDVDNPSYDRFAADPTIKVVLCTSNFEPAQGKFFMYILANNEGRKLYVLECREELLVNILKFAKRGVLESDYVMQEKKQKSV